MEHFAEYGHAVVSLAGLGLLWAVLGPLSAVMKERSGAAPGGDVAPDYANPAYRWSRAYANLTETAPAFVAVVVAAMAAGASPFWTNLLAALFLLSRIVVAFVHIRGLGKPAHGLRSILFTIGWASVTILAVFAIIAVF